MWPSTVLIMSVKITHLMLSNRNLSYNRTEKLPLNSLFDYTLCHIKIVSCISFNFWLMYRSIDLLLGLYTILWNNVSHFKPSCWTSLLKAWNIQCYVDMLWANCHTCIFFFIEGACTLSPIVTQLMTWCLTYRVNGMFCTIFTTETSLNVDPTCMLTPQLFNPYCF